MEEKSLRANTEKGWNSSYRVHIGPHFGHIRIGDITEHEILVFRKMLEQKGLRESTINDRVMKLLCMSLFRAYKRGLINVYPCDGLKRLSEPKTEIDPFSFDELVQFLNSLKTRNPEYYELFFIWSRTGLRPGELFALKWRHVDYFNKKLMIRETKHPSGPEGPPKTRHSIRDIDLRQEMVTALKVQEAKTGLMDGYIFMTHANRPFSDAFMRKKFRHLLRKAGLKYRPPKQMRHTFATLHIAAGENLTWVSEMLGHSSVEITMKRYNRFIQNLTREDGSAFELMMEKKKLDNVKENVIKWATFGP